MKRIFLGLSIIVEIYHLHWISSFSIQEIRPLTYLRLIISNQLSIKI
jgi:hypothetical protein